MKTVQHSVVRKTEFNTPKLQVYTVCRKKTHAKCVWQQVHWLSVFVLYMTGSFAKPTLKCQICIFAGLSFVSQWEQDVTVGFHHLVLNQKVRLKDCGWLSMTVTGTRMCCGGRTVLDRMSVSCECIHTSCLCCRKTQAQLSYNTCCRFHTELGHQGGVLKCKLTKKKKSR